MLKAAMMHRNALHCVAITFTGKSVREHGLPTSAPAPSTGPFVSVVGPHLKWSHHRHKRVGGWRECKCGRCPSGPISEYTFFLCLWMQSLYVPFYSSCVPSLTVSCPRKWWSGRAIALLRESFPRRVRFSLTTLVPPGRSPRPAPGHMFTCRHITWWCHHSNWWCHLNSPNWLMALTEEQKPQVIWFNTIHPIAPIWAQRIPISLWEFIWRF